MWNVDMQCLISLKTLNAIFQWGINVVMLTICSFKKVAEEEEAE